MNYRLITIEGNIGAGKTTLSTLLAKQLDARLVLEEFSDNPFLPKFYADPDRYGFPLELFFMAERFKQLNALLEPDMFHQVTVSDYLFIKCLLFAKVTLAEQEYQLYKRLFDIIHQQLIYPDILIYLQAPVAKLQSNIHKRNRSYEQQIPDEYLNSIQQSYLSYIQQRSGITLMVDASNANFLEDPRHLQVILEALEKDYTQGIHRLSLP
ncbi:Deoxyadenosine/deoxycytidine kinase [Arachidicoccus rhizosphaerae]|uniref:Deoxyadenosine/deoxycytidine kinase n=1 Tax=Arachidicoccus rhizosphaerae TaxID=551991 RepID=A0A1H3XV07_9BACT|nr:deoxynucleoside kinase [Arachidicoccus rhizosphaerae]SEA02711.1 Deoxyadenosine/deoxycytidine kinase [Arachidicoccus rhizosphaerae]